MIYMYKYIHVYIYIERERDLCVYNKKAAMKEGRGGNHAMRLLISSTRICILLIMLYARMCMYMYI